MPVWPTCFWIICPMPPPPPMRLPAASTPMSFIDTPPSLSAAITASAARSTVSLSGYLPNFVMWMPRIQMSPLAIVRSPSDRFEAEADGLDALIARANPVDCQLHLNAELHVLGTGLRVDDVPRTLVPSQS